MERYILLFFVIMMIGLGFFCTWQGGQISALERMVSEGQERERMAYSTYRVSLLKAEDALESANDLVRLCEDTIGGAGRWIQEILSMPSRWLRRFRPKLKTEWAGLPPPEGVGVGGPEVSDE